MQKRFENQFVLVTGAGAGIGRACAMAFANEGAAVAAIDRDRKDIDETIRLIEKEGGRALEILADVTDEQAVARAVEKATKTFGHLDIAVNNAGISQSVALTADISVTEWNRVLNVNVTGTWLCMREELRHMSVRGSGAIVNTASFAGLRTLAMNTAYVVSKHAVVGLTKNAAVEYAAKGIRINAVAPGGIATPMMERSFGSLDADQRAAALKAIAELHPMKRVGAPGEIADAILFLCSAQASFITGTCLSVDGGWAAS
jgi:A-factor type gamma-butyrolactone 1'-reductase (1S-forming)